MLKTTVSKDAQGGNWPALGNAAVVAFLEKNLSHGKLAQAYIFSGPADLGKFTIALAFARNLLVTDPNYLSDDRERERNELDPVGLNGDIHILKLEENKKNISIEQTRAF
ncbi:MAG: hypothetical protein NTX66_00460, partial [Candidatus Falkowbacteria bacterium]|nr:hypothetical protein [Candidatus Falkowbacteria bacterium]